MAQWFVTVHRSSEDLVNSITSHHYVSSIDSLRVLDIVENVIVLNYTSI